MNGKIGSQHIERKAVVYLRQSSLRQVHENRESTTRQYALSQRAIGFGWSPNDVQVVDEDLGQSGGSTEGREGFQRLAEDVAHGRVGAIFALEASRLSRSSADWHRLLDLCGLADVLIADELGVYAPRDPNDRLLLGLKGQMSEAELYWMRLRLQGAKMSKARRGELRFTPPTGYVWDEVARRMRLDPDEQVQEAVRLVFERFRVDGSAHGASRWFARNNLKIPARRPGEDEVRWVPPRWALLHRMMCNPMYTGAYVFGRHEDRPGLVGGELRRRKVTKLPQEAWKVCLRDQHAAYIGWEEFMANQEKLHENRNGPRPGTPRGAAREGAALLQGLTICGKCGHRMHVSYPGSKRWIAYKCASPGRQQGTGEVCWSVSGGAIDEAVAALFLQATQPPEIELAFAVARETERQAETLDRQWRLRLDRVRYDARIAERRYKAVDPDNRVVARTLERDWEEKLREVEAAERDYEEARTREKVVLSDADRARILELARDLPKVWNAPSTSHAQRKTLLRLLVRGVTLTPIDVPRRTRVQVLWETGAVSDIVIDRPLGNPNGLNPAAAVEHIRGLVAAGMRVEWIVADLNAKGFRTGAGRPWDLDAVHRVKRRHGWKGRGRGPATTPTADGLYTTAGIAALCSVTVPIVRRWIKHGWLQPVDPTAGSWRFRLTDDDLKQLEVAKATGYGPRRQKTATQVEGVR